MIYSSKMTKKELTMTEGEYYWILLSGLKVESSYKKAYGTVQTTQKVETFFAFQITTLKVSKYTKLK